MLSAVKFFIGIIQMIIDLQHKSDETDVEKLLDLAFGPDRHSKAAYSFREGVPAIGDLSFVIRDGGKLIATLQFWPVQIKGQDVLLLGPIAVEPELQGKGYGIGLMRHGLERAKMLGYKRIVLVGDEPYYARLGFSRQMADNFTMEGQKDLSRLLALELEPGAFSGLAGAIEKHQ